jgi:hypothetical protein
MIASILLSTALLATPVNIHTEEQRATQHHSMMGIKPSVYRGIWYTPRLEDERRCIMMIESHGNYRAANPISSARGAYQFLDSQWRQGLVWMFLAETKKTKDGLADEAKQLRAIPINKWPRYWQDRAFYTAARFGEGLHHWAHPQCY